VQILSNLDTNVMFDVSKTFAAQKKAISKKLLPAVKSAMNPSLEAYDTEIIGIIRQLHKSRREIWKLNQEGRIDEHNKRQHMTSRRDQVRNFIKFMQLINFINILTLFNFNRKWGGVGEVSNI
jgi:hypothetical protein